MTTTSLNDILFASARASVAFARRCLEPTPTGLRAKSSFVTPDGEVMHWHDFGDLEGPGWAANAVGGATLLYRWARYLGDEQLAAEAQRTHIPLYVLDLRVQAARHSKHRL